MQDEFEEAVQEFQMAARAFAKRVSDLARREAMSGPGFFRPGQKRDDPSIAQITARLHKEILASHGNDRRGLARRLVVSADALKTPIQRLLRAKKIVRVKEHGVWMFYRAGGGRS